MAWCETGSLRRFAPLLVGVALAFVIAILGVRVDSGGFQARIERSLLAAEGTSQALDEASAGRISIWRTAIDMALAHPLTGVGARGFRHDYGEHARADDRFVRDPPPGGVAHAHQIVLEVASETGLVGLAGWLTGLAVMRRAWRRADAAARARAFAPALALVAMCFPLNTHLAFYSAWWGLLFWWLLALYCAALAPPRRSDWAISLPRPLRLLPVPEPITVTAPVPDDPPVAFRWRDLYRRVVRAEGPERIAPEWWRERGTVRLRDYYRIEDRAGRRYWLYRHGRIGDGRGGVPQWFLQGLFA